MPFTTAVQDHPDKPALIMAADGSSRTFRQIDDASRRLAARFDEAGLRAGDGIALLLENEPAFFDAFWAGMRTGLMITPLNRYSSPEEIDYVLADSGAKALVVSGVLLDRAAALPSVAGLRLRITTGPGKDGFDALSDIVDETTPPPREDPTTATRGDFVNYSSGTTGRPKGIRRPAQPATFAEPTVLEALLAHLYGVDGTSVYLSPAPLYHSAPLGFTSSVMALGGTVVVLDRFDPLASLAAIERYGVTHSQWVPTMFVRLLRLTEAERSAHDLSTMRIAIHAAAPCPPQVKEQMIEWWGPVIREYYAATELHCMTHITSEEWLAHRGSVGRPVLGTLHICDEAGDELPPGTPGTIYSELDGPLFEYHNDPEKTAASRHPDHPSWSTVGDIGFVDDDGYLHLTDRKAFMIISGGVNIYPQEIEHVLIDHPAIADVAVFGVPDDEMGERVLAVVELREGHTPSQPGLEDDIKAFARRSLSAYKVPKEVRFVDVLPRLETGKLYKKALRDSIIAETTASDRVNA